MEWGQMKRNLLVRAVCACFFLIGAFMLAPTHAYASGGVKTVYRLYHEGTLDHHYSMDAWEYKVLGESGWRQEGVAWSSPSSSSTPVYRLYHPGTLDHHYTKDAWEYQVLGSVGWEQEGVAWYSDDAKGVPVYRLYHEGTLNHHYTMDYNEYRVLGSVGWTQEGVAWYGVAANAGNGGSSVAPVTRTPIMAASQASAEQMAAYYRAMVGESTYPSSVYSNYGAPQLIDFCNIVLQEAQAEGVRAEVVFAQAMKETGWLRFGGAVKAEQCNFCGLGAVNSAPTSAASFKDVRTGIRAQVQHLKAYASTDALVNECVDPRFNLVKRGCAPTLEELNGKWAVPGDGYGESIAKMIDKMLATSA